MALANDQRSQLEALYAEIDPYVGHALEFTNPADGGSIMPTISAHVRLIPAGFETKPRKASDGTIFVVVEGQGSAMIAGEEIRLGLRDTLCVPSWKETRFIAETDLVLFAYSDKASQEKLNLYREWNA
ncbi:MAG: hypothetical protein KGJ57_14215 [Sphingomonadales bacterium]|nr:hypothetical protein [Sphingomonadales bacterium]MDE2170559.1 hypothetical protein [Sphingomonadales bacterium]